MRHARSRTTALTLSLAFLAAAAPALAQQRALDHEDALHWNTIGSPSLSPDGNWLVFVLTAMEGDPLLVVRAASEGSEPLTLRGTSPRFTWDSRFVVYEVPPVEAVVDSLRREGKRGDALPKDSLGVVDLGGGGMQARTVSAVEGHRVAGTGSWVAYVPVEEEEEAEEAEEPAEPAEEEEEEGDEADEGERKDKEEGSDLVLLSLNTGEETRYDMVTDYFFAEDAEVLAFATSTSDGSGDGAYVVDLDDMTRHAVIEGEGNYRQLAISDDGSQVAFLADRDDYEADQPEFTLYHGAGPSWSGAAMANSATEGVPDGWWVSENGNVSFSDGGGRVRFGTAPRPEPEEEDDTLDDDRVTLDVWNWRDPYLQPMQLVQANQERNRTYAAVVHLDGGGVVQLGTPEIPTVRFAAEGDAAYAVGATDVPYRQLISWDGRYNDVYAIDVATGEQRMVAERVKGFGGAAISPMGGYASWWDGEARHWMVAPLDGGEAMAASAEVPHAVWNELDDHPDLPPPYGPAVWTEGDNAIVFYDRYDAWRFEPASGETTNLTGGAGRESGTRFRYARTDFEDPAIAEGEALWQAFHYLGKQSGFHRGRTDRAATPEPVIMADKTFRFRGKADDADRWLITREDFREFPDLRVTGGEGVDIDFSGMVKVSDANPQQADYRWGSAEIVEWHSNDGTPLQGILFTPDGFDPSTQYPMMVYFYERMSDGVHQYRSPRPGGSSVSVPFYVSRGYVVFIPDIPYEVGYPGESALDAVVPGVLSLVARGFVKEDRIGVQGHSWGGYQIAYMITKTNLFAAAEAGAPVSNMTSAYGGIRWQSGMSRMFQYERTQSRIGGTLWESTNEYLHNSPVFYADKIHTPLLMMHNDEDGAVPWYQGIEMFVAMRRLQKPVWMLNYNGQGHGLSREADRKDWAIRMQQFFDHYLMDAPAPVWMEEGVPAILKGKTLGLEVKRRVS
ncbi:MAG: prolyl oligopeptidase family serine peptidase [Gemmatimonadetes bacterium]|nr:prolyl oligopeptidase family serine peptidase [Gemmatimonadota bacterium]